ncbi:hypothetical protein Tco_0797411 [Tanacetum coccineum]
MEVLRRFWVSLIIWKEDVEKKTLVYMEALEMTISKGKRLLGPIGGSGGEFERGLGIPTPSPKKCGILWWPLVERGSSISESGLEGYIGQALNGVKESKFEEKREEWKTKVRWDLSLWLMVRSVWMVGLEPVEERSRVVVLTLE